MRLQILAFNAMERGFWTLQESAIALQIFLGGMKLNALHAVSLNTSMVKSALVVLRARNTTLSKRNVSNDYYQAMYLIFMSNK